MVYKKNLENTLILYFSTMAYTPQSIYIFSKGPTTTSPNHLCSAYKFPLQRYYFCFA